MKTPIISICTGTYNRRASLARMIDSARHEIPRGLDYDFIVCDAGSTDGTLEYLRQQPDVRLIEHGELRGAIKAFCDCARASTADYILFANDDISFRPYSILAAISHLERNPRCGQVAFADNRYSLLHGDGTLYRVEGVGGILPDGSKVVVAYAQVSLTRKWLGDKVGWWGDQDPIMKNARTYGGDNFLSACIWEAGYTVDAVPQAQIEDHIVRDDLRMMNSAGPNDNNCYYKRFPDVPLPATYQNPPPNDRLRILNLPIYEFSYPGRKNKEKGLTEALADYGIAIEWDIFNEPVDVIELVKAWQPDLLTTQIQGPCKQLSPYILASCRNVAPSMVMVNWNGDAHEQNLLRADVVDMLRFVDLQLTVNAKVLPEYEKLNIRAAYWQIGYKDPVDDLPMMPEYEVLFAGNCYNEERQQMVKLLRSMRLENTRRPKVGIYGNCEYSDGNTHYDFAAQRALYQRATIIVGDTFPGTRAFVSNRLFQVLAAGGFLLQQYSEDLDKFTGLIPGEHYIEWKDLPDLAAKIIYWLHPDRQNERLAIAEKGRTFVRENFSYSAQARKLFNDLLPMIEVTHEPA